MSKINTYNNKIFDFLDNNKLRIAYEWLENGYDLYIAHEMGSIEKELDTYKKELKDADNEIKEVEYNLYKSLHMFESLQHFNDGEKIKMLFQMENDRILAESINDHETTLQEQEENDRILAESINDYEMTMNLQEQDENNNLKIVSQDLERKEKDLSISEMTKLLKESKLGNYLVTKNNKQKKKRKKRKRRKKRKKNKNK